MPSLRRFAVAVATLASVTNAVASPVVMKATLTGTVGPITGYDQTGVFGPPGTDLIGAPFVLTLTYDLSFGQRATSAGASDELIGGPALGLSNPLLDTALTINGVTAHIPTAGHMVMLITEDAFNISAQSPTPSLVMNHVTMFVASPGFIPRLDADISPISITGGEDFLIRTDFPTGGGSSVMAFGQLVGKTFSLQHVSDVPEPATPLLLLAGFAFGYARLRWRA